MARFYAVIDRDRDDVPYAVMVLTDQHRPGHTRAYRWVPNLEVWVDDAGLLRDLRSHELDRVNIFDELAPAAAQSLAARLPAVTEDWVLDAYRGEPRRLTRADVGLG